MGPGHRRTRPLLVVFEDLHWADPSTVELIGRLVRARIPGLLLLVTAREEVKIPWADATVIELDRLSIDELAELARRLPEGRNLDEADLRRAIERSDGVPLFLEELVRTASVAHGQGTTSGTIPAALRDLLLARFAVPGVDLRLAQLLATIGAEAPLPLVASVAKGMTNDVDQELSALVDAGIVDLLPGDPASYRFRHHLLAELAYDTQLIGARQAAHRAVADALQEGLATSVTGGPAVLAHHLERGGRIGDAVIALAAAAEAARALGANAEVDDLLGRAFTLLDQVEGDRRASVEFEVRLLRGTHAASILGYAAPQSKEDFGACLELVEEVRRTGFFGEDAEDEEHLRDELVWAGAGLWAVFMLQGQLGMARSINDSLTGHCVPGSPLHDYFDSCACFVDLFAGDYRSSEARIHRNLELYDGVVVSNRMSVPSDPRVTAEAHLAFLLAAAGRPDEARLAIGRGLEYAETLPFPRGPFSGCYITSIAAGVELMYDEVAAARAHTAQVLDVAERHGFTFWSLVAGYYAAALDLYEGDDAAADRARMSVELLRAVGVHVWLPSFLATISLPLLRRGQPDKARDLLLDAVAGEDATDADFWSAEVQRQLGEADLALGDPSGLDRIRRAVEVAVQQGAGLLELRARTSLCSHTPDADELAALAELVTAFGPDLRAPEVAAARALVAQGAPTG